MSSEQPRDVQLLSLDDAKTQELAHTITRGAGKKIMDYLSEQQATESELSKALDIPLSTVHYNIKSLEQAGLIEWTHYHYSAKGKEVRHYRAANTCIVITPSKFGGDWQELFRSLLPGVMVTLVAATLWYFAEGGTQATTYQDAGMMATESASRSADAIGSAAMQSSMMWLGILIGGLLFAMTFIVWRLIKQRYQK